MVLMRVRAILTFLSLLHLGTPKSPCGSKSCHPTKNDHINVHVIAHTHDDVGWTKTVDEYYSAEDGGVRNILNSTFHSLMNNKKRRFMYVESAFLFKWWNEQTSWVKSRFRQLINNGQIELVSGAWTMNDEATTNYQSIIDQFTLGLRKINDTFGSCGRPKVGWQIDPFGHSNEMASIFAHLGFDGLFLGRIDHHDKKNRFRTNTAEVIWQGNKSLGKKSQIFTTVLFNTYWPPDSFCVDPLCSGPFDFDDLDSQWDIMEKFLIDQTTVYRTNNVILTMGGDFHFAIAEENFRALDNIIKLGNSKQRNGTKFHFIYSTPSCYLKAVHGQAAKAKIKWPVLTDDFFPYASTDFKYWTGFYTSRPTLKRFERMGNNFLQICKQLSVLANLNNTRKIDTLAKAMGNLQHHDAITGTEKQAVANDYSKTLRKGFADCNDISSESLNKLLTTADVYNPPDIPFNSCLLANISQCKFAETSDNFVVTIYNPLSRPVDHFVRVPVTKGLYSVKGPNDELPHLQIVAVPKEVLHIPGRQSIAEVEIVFPAHQVPPLGFKSYYIRKNPRDGIFNNMQDLHQDKKLSITIDNQTGLLCQINIKGREIPIRQEFLYYHGAADTSGNSGAYIFRPEKQKATKVAEKAKIETYFGAVLLEIHQIFNKWVSQIIKVYHNESFVELEWLVGPLPHNDYSTSFEVISRYTTYLNSEATFYTDSNGREMQRRVRNLRANFEIPHTEPVASNYYPVTSKIRIRDSMKKLEVAVLSDRSQGGTSVVDGQIELMVHRNSLVDDGLGVDEALDEIAFHNPLVARGSHYLVTGTYSNDTDVTLASIEKDVAQRKLLEAWTFLSSTKDLSYHDYSALYKLEYSGLNSALPRNVQILTLEPLSNHKLLLRLEHIFEKDEDPVLSLPVVVDIEHLFAAFKVVKLRETTLGGNQWLDQSKPMTFVAKEKLNIETNSRRIRFRSKGNEHSCEKGRASGGKFRICLGPMQIRTFVLEIKRNV